MGEYVAGSHLRLAERFRPQALVLRGPVVVLALALVFAVLAVLSAGAWRHVFAVGAATLAAMVLIQAGWRSLAQRQLRLQEARLAQIVAMDVTPCFTTDAFGQVGHQNHAAVALFGAREGGSILAALNDHFAAPSAVVYRLQSRANSQGAAREDVVTQRGQTRLSVHRISDHSYLWRLEDFSERGGAGRGAETLSLPMLTANRAGVILFSNEAMRRLLGGRPKRLADVFGSQLLHSGEEIELASITGPMRAVFAEVAGSGERREIYLLPTASAQPSAANMADFEHLPVALLKFDTKGVLLQANKVAREFLQLAEDAAPIHELFDGLGRPVADWLADVACEHLPSGVEVLRARNLEGEVFLQVTLRRIVEAGRPSVLAVLQDATALKTLEAQFVQSQKMQAIGQLAGGVAHDFNNLLTAISGHCDLLLLRHKSEDPEYSDLIQIHQNANRAAALVGQLLAFSRKQTLNPERLDLADVLSDLTHLLNRLVGERVLLRLSHAAHLGAIRADKRQLEQVIMNLVVNARDAMAAGGTIAIDTQALHLASDLHRDRAVVPAGDYAVIRVADSGCGIPPDRLTKIFEPFFTTKRVGEGTGLGLSTAYGIVKQSGGYIFVDSTEGEGSSFQLYFPIYHGEAIKDAAKLNKPQLLRQGEGVVLLVEDEAPVRAFASRALRMRGFTVLEAESAEAALQILEDETLKIDIFVTDVVMPGMDGPTWVRIALQQRPQVRVIFVSGYAEESLSEGQSRIPNSTFLAKPFSLSELTETVHAQCN
ncbi:ATP-binding protein [Cypionkella sp.]|uniref:hybrid sensor histidine kinase/response regulator n=1 Tax=Cypionkella sp. TaxID=2811411 RepID=UPI003753431C